MSKRTNRFQVDTARFLSDELTDGIDLSEQLSIMRDFHVDYENGDLHVGSPQYRHDDESDISSISSNDNIDDTVAYHKLIDKFTQIKCTDSIPNDKQEYYMHLDLNKLNLSENEKPPTKKNVKK